MDLAEDLNRISTSSSPFPDRSSATNSPRPSVSTPMLPPTGPSMTMSPITPTSVPDLVEQEPELDPSDDEVSTRKTLAQSFEDLEIYPTQEHFLGKSSSMMFLQAALDIKREYVVGSPSGKRHDAPPTHSGPESAMRRNTDKEEHNWKEREQPNFDARSVNHRTSFPFNSKRPEFWLEHSVRGWRHFFIALITDTRTYELFSGSWKRWRTATPLTFHLQTCSTQWSRAISHCSTFTLPCYIARVSSGISARNCTYVIQALALCYSWFVHLEQG